MQSDLENQAFCNRCGGQLRIIPVEPTQGRYSISYQCTNCGVGPAEENPAPAKQSYAYNFSHKLGAE